MPLKRLDRYSHIATPPRFSFSVATSKYFAEILAGAFEVPEQDVEVIGLPRNDILVDSTIPDSRLVLQQLKVSSYIVMLPTFRTSTFGPRWRDGSDEILRIQPGQLDRLNGVLFEHGLALLLKAHPLASKAVMDSWRCDHSVMIDEDWLRSRGITLYGILGGASALITDYSSVAVDFMVTRRPCILYQPDSSDYGSLRGFAVSDDAWDTLGYRVTSIEALISQIDTLALEGYCVAPRRSPFLLTVPLAGAAERVFESVERRIACSSQKV
jgi:CDP-glycerol glycerophosphotransferase (TagB/SpsB family)